MVAPYVTDEVRPLVSPAPSTLQVVDKAATDGVAHEFVNLSSEPSSELAAELAGAAEWLGVRPEEILLAALGRALGRTRGEGLVTVDVTGGHRWLFHGVSLLCSSEPTMTPTEMLQGAHTALAAAPGRPSTRSEVLLNLDGAAEDGVRDGHVLELNARRVDEELHLDWWYDATRFDPYSVEEIVEQFPQALIEITSDAASPL